MSLVAVRAALETALAAMTPALDTAYENKQHTPVQGTPYQAVYLMPAAPVNPEMGRLTQERGFMQVSLFYPLGTGPAAATARAELIRQTFYRGRSFVASGVTTTIENTPEIAPAMVDDDRYHVPVRIRFFSHHTP